MTTKRTQPKKDRRESQDFTSRLFQRTQQLPESKKPCFDLILHGFLAGLIPDAEWFPQEQAGVKLLARHRTRRG